MDLTVGQLLLRDILPADVYDGQPLTKPELTDVMSRVAKQYPERYEEISHKLVRLGLKTGESVGGSSFGDEDLRTSRAGAARAVAIRGQMKAILDKYDGPERYRRVRELLEGNTQLQIDDVLRESDADGNAFAQQLKGAGRGSAGALTSMRAGNIAVADSSGMTVPIPITRGYSSGVTPMQYLGLSYGARKGLVGTKLGVGEGGFLAKLLTQAGHRLVVTDTDDEVPIGQKRGFMVDTQDHSNIGALLAHDYGPFKRNDIITPKVQAALSKSGFDEILVRSPIAASNLQGGVYARDAGLRESGRLASVGDAVGQQAGQAIGEIATQLKLSSKHSGGRLSTKGSRPGLQGFDLVEKLTNLSENARGLSAHAMEDGRVTQIKDAPQGGKYVYIGEHAHYVAPDFEVQVKVGEAVEAGMPISNGVPNPAIVTKLRGIGEGRKYLVGALREAMGGKKIDRRQLELLSSGLIDRVRFNEEYGEFTPDSVVPYSRVERLYEAREDHEERSPAEAEGYYLEEPVMHYSIGTRITPSIRKSMEKLQLNRLRVHKQPPPFQPEVTRGLDLLSTDPDWMTRFLGSNLKKSLQQATHFGATSDENSTSFVPSRARAVNFGRMPLQQQLPMDTEDLEYD